MTLLTNDDLNKLSDLIKWLKSHDKSDWDTLRQNAELPELNMVQISHNCTVYSWYDKDNIIGYIVIAELDNDLYEWSGDIKNVDAFMEQFRNA